LLKQWDKAIADATRAIDLEPKQGWYRVRRGDIYLDKGDTQKALADYDTGIKVGGALHPEYGFLRRADLNERLGRWDRALSDWTEMDKIRGIGSLPQRLFVLLIDCPDRTLRDPRRALSLDQKYGQLMWAHEPESRRELLGKAHFQMGEWKKAIAEMAKLPDRFVVARFLVAMAHWHLGNQGEAQKCYSRAVELALAYPFPAGEGYRKQIRESWAEANELLASPKKQK
jgi:tetratricopeptide (TPR) repeat protein